MEEYLHKKTLLMKDRLNIAIAQIAPVWLNKKLTIKKIETAIKEAAAQKAQLVCFGETLLPAIPFGWNLQMEQNLTTTSKKKY